MYPHERSLVKRLAGKPFAIVGVNSDDDREETVRKRIATYHAVTKPLVNYYLDWAKSGDPRAPRAATSQQWCLGIRP